MLRKWMPPGGDVEPLRLFRTLAIHDDLASRMRPLGAGILGHGRVEPREREIVIHRTCARAGAEYEWGVHVLAFGMPLGFTEEQVEATVAGPPDAPCWSARDSLLLRLSRRAARDGDRVGRPLGGARARVARRPAPRARRHGGLVSPAGVRDQRRKSGARALGGALSGNVPRVVSPAAAGRRRRREMAWDFSTEPEFQEHLDWMRDFVREEIWPHRDAQRARDGPAPAGDRAAAGAVKERGLWAAHLDPELGGQGFGQVKLGLMHEILGTSPLAPFAFGNQAPDSGNSEILALAGTDGAEGALAPSAARGRPALGVLDDRAGDARARTRRCCRRARSATATSGSSTATSGSRRTPRSPTS